MSTTTENKNIININTNINTNTNTNTRIFLCESCGERYESDSCQCECGMYGICQNCCAGHCDIDCKSCKNGVERGEEIYTDCGILYCSDCWNDEGQGDHYRECESCREDHFARCDYSDCCYKKEWYSEHPDECPSDFETE